MHSSNLYGSRQPHPALDRRGDFFRQGMLGELVVLRRDVARAIAETQAELDRMRSE